MDIALIIFGLLFIIASMAFVLNPPEAWVKKAFHRSESPKTAEDSAKPARRSGEKLK
jgi:hypothetical protein